MKRDREQERRDRKELLQAVIESAKSGRKFSANKRAAEKHGADPEALEQAFQARRSDPQHAALLDRLHNDQSNLLIDAKVKTGLSGHRIKMDRFPLDYRRYVVRKMIHVAYLDCQNAKLTSRKANAVVAEDVFNKSEKAAKALRALRRALRGDRGGFNGIPAASAFAFALQSLSASDPSSGGGEFEKDRAAALKRAATLIEAEAACNDLAECAKRLEQRLNRSRDDPDKQRANEKKIPEAAFATPVMETWAYLTGRQPSSKDGASPFLSFLRAAWQDAYPIDDQAAQIDDGPSFSGVLKRPKPGWRDRGDPTSDDYRHAHLLAVSESISFDAALGRILHDKPTWL